MLDGLVDAMRDTVLRTLSASVGVRSRTRSRTATGGSTYAWSAAVYGPGRLMATSNQEMEFTDKLGISATHVIIVPWDTIVQVDDKVVVDSIEYDVTGVMDHQQPMLKRIFAARVES